MNIIWRMVDHRQEVPLAVMLSVVGVSRFPLFLALHRICRHHLRGMTSISSMLLNCAKRVFWISNKQPAAIAAWPFNVIEMTRTVWSVWNRHTQSFTFGDIAVRMMHKDISFFSWALEIHIHHSSLISSLELPNHFRVILFRECLSHTHHFDSSPCISTSTSSTQHS